MASSLDPSVLSAVRAAVREVAHGVWSGKQEVITRAELVAALEQAPEVPEEVRWQAVGLLAINSASG
jgi:hypothetical protein